MYVHLDPCQSFSFLVFYGRGIVWDVNVPVDMKAPGMRVYDRVMDDDNRWSFKRIDSAILFREYMREQKREVGEGGE